MILVDSSVWIDAFRGVETVQVIHLRNMLGKQPVAVGDLILTEILQGCNTDREFNAVRHRLLSLSLIELGGRQAAIQAASNYRTLRAIGITPRKTIDTLIATRCILDDIPLLYSDRDFDPFVQHLGLRSALDSASGVN